MDDIRHLKSIFLTAMIEKVHCSLVRYSAEVAGNALKTQIVALEEATEAELDDFRDISGYVLGDLSELTGEEELILVRSLSEVRNIPALGVKVFSRALD